MNALASLSGVAAAAFSPVIVSASPALLEVGSFTDLATSTDLAAPLRNREHDRWRSLASVPTCASWAHAAARAGPDGLADDGTPIRGFRYCEYAPTNEDRVWMTAGFAFASSSPARSGVSPGRPMCAAWRPTALAAAW